MIQRIKQWFRLMYYRHILKRGAKASEWIEFDDITFEEWGNWDLPFPIKDEVDND